jgi:hypothetical protein
VAYQAQHTTSTSWSTTDYTGGRRMFIAEALVTIPGGKMAEIRLAAAGY